MDFAIAVTLGDGRPLALTVRFAPVSLLVPEIVPPRVGGSANAPGMSSTRSTIASMGSPSGLLPMAPTRYLAAWRLGAWATPWP